MSPEQRRWNFEQAIASARIEGFEPDAEFLAEVEAVIRGELTSDQLCERILSRARRIELANLVDRITPANRHDQVDL